MKHMRLNVECVQKTVQRFELKTSAYAYRIGSGTTNPRAMRFSVPRCGRIVLGEYIFSTGGSSRNLFGLGAISAINKWFNAMLFGREPTRRCDDKIGTCKTCLLCSPHEWKHAKTNFCRRTCSTDPLR